MNREPDPEAEGRSAPPTNRLPARLDQPPASAEQASTLDAAARDLGSLPPDLPGHALFAALAPPGGARALRALYEGGALQALFPFVASWRGFDQGDYHSFDLLEHSLRTAERVEGLAAAPRLPEPLALAGHLAEEMEEGITRLALLKFAAFFHDIAKPETLTLEGARHRFLSHDVRGGHRVRALLAALGAGRRTQAAAQRTVAAHLRLFSLMRQNPPTKRARERYLHDLGHETPEALLLSLADEAATGPNPPFLAELSRTASEVLTLHWEKKAGRPVEPLVRGLHLRESGIPEGPALGKLLRRIADAQMRGEVGSRADALALAKRLWDEDAAAPERSR